MATKLSMLVYDIRSNSKCIHPVHVLRNRALHFQLSCWIIAHDRIPWTYLRELDAEQIGNIWDVIDFADDITPAVANILIRNLRREIEDAAKRETASLERLDEQERTAVDEGTRSRDKRNKDRQSVLNRTEKLLKELEQAAQLYNIDISALPFSSSRDRLSALRGVNGVRAALVSQMAMEAAQTPYAAAAKADEMPVGILMDALEDQGVDVSAARAAFSETPQVTERNITSSNGNGTTPTRTPPRSTRVQDRQNGTTTQYHCPLPQRSADSQQSPQQSASSGYLLDAQ